MSAAKAACGLGLAETGRPQPLRSNELVAAIEARSSV
jgi:hypothetical protein